MHYPISTSTNQAMFLGLILLHVGVLFALPALLTLSTWWALAIVPFAWLAMVHWGLIHEAIHKLLFINATTNEVGGRALAIFLGTSFHVVRFGHLMHHKLNRQFHSDHVANPHLGQRVYYYLYLVMGLYLSEIYSGILFLMLPRKLLMKLATTIFLKDYKEVAVAGERFFYERGNILPTRMDVALGLGLYGAAFYLYGNYWPYLLAFVALRGMVISFMDNIYHYATPADNSKPGKELALPGFVSALLLHGNYHETHHTNPSIPWKQLPLVHTQQKRAFDGDLLSHGWMQFRGPSPA